MEQIYALVDCNSFYASCEKIFRPDLYNKPVIVLSNNDGCIVAMSAEAKKIGITRGTPIFKLQHLIDKNEITVFSSNYELYADISNRIMTILESFSPDIEVYSIDEAFISLSGIQNDIIEYCQKIKKTIFKNTGIAVSIGIGTTKTLSKLANNIAKKYGCYKGVFSIINHQNIQKIFSTFNVGEVWGIGGRLSEKLLTYNVKTIADLLEKDDYWIKEKMSVKGVATVRELRGIEMLDLMVNTSSKQTIVSSRSFGRPVETLKEMKEACAYYATLAADKLRKQNSICGCINIYITTNYFRENDPQYYNDITIRLDPLTSVSTDLIIAAISGLEKIYRSGFSYKKCAVMLLDIHDKNDVQAGLFDDSSQTKKEKLMTHIDSITLKYGKSSLTSAAFGYHKNWEMKRQMKSPSYTTNWNEIAIVKI